MKFEKSPSTRREWIEMSRGAFKMYSLMSPSTRREWIEMLTLSARPSSGMSPSTRREWIEILLMYKFLTKGRVSLHTEGVD